MSTTQRFTKPTDESRKSASRVCRGTTCRLGICPPCLLVWGMVAVFVLGKALLEVLR